MPKTVKFQPNEFRPFGLLLKIFTVEIAVAPILIMAAVLGMAKIVLFDWILALWLLSLVFVAFRTAEWPCPVCGKPFCRKTVLTRVELYAQRCVHCGLKRPNLGFFD